MKKYLIIYILTFFFISQTHAQSDTAFWFAAPDVDVVNNPLYGQYDRPIYLRLTSSTSAANITVSLPANTSFAPINLSIPPNSTSTIELTPWIDLIENFESSTVNNKGIYIQSSSAITAYYEVNSTTCHCNPELFSLKGRNALGNDFFVPSQLTWSIDTVRFPDAKAAFDIVATQNNTSIVITPSNPLIGHAANTPFTITLNRGQSYSCQGLYRSGPSLLNGSKIVADKPVAVTTKEDLLFSDGACADLAGDQIIPTSIFGNEYAIVRGDLTVRDKAVITAKQNNTLVYLNGSAVSAATINAGQSYEVDISAQPSLYISTNNAVSVLHYTGSGCEVGAAVIPKLNCTGSSSVSIVRSNSGNAVVLLVTKTGNQNNFLVNGAAGIITAANFSPLAGSGGNYVYAKINLNSTMLLNTTTTFSNTSGKFQLGFINGDPGGYMYGYFSDFKKSNVSNTQAEVCKLDSTQLNANGGVTYQWSPAAGLSNPNISNPKAAPSVTTNYKVIITDIDGCIDSAFVKVIVNNCTLSCDNWLSTPSEPSYVDAGNLNITGNKITVEATINRTQPYTPGTGSGNEGDIVSKHLDPSDVNYLLRPNHAYITTSSGFYGTPDICDLQLNKTYHVAMVYDGATLKFYRDGFLMSQVAASGNLIQNTWPTRIGKYTGTNSENFLGYINEVRIWNVARSQAEIRAYMNSSLPSPTTQPGLQAYYIFDNLINKQGNTAYNGVLNGAATINASNPDCAMVADSCGATIPTCGGNFDFSYTQDVCNPLSVQFLGGGTTLTNPYWSFGDAGTALGSINPTHTYAAPGNYTVRFTIDNPACNDTITKTISITSAAADIILTPDTTICFGSTKQLRAQGSPAFCWSPTTYLSNPNSSTPTTSTPKTITYYYTSLVTGNNLITNGDFSQGNTGFTSQYIYNNASGFNAGVYNVGNNLPAWHPAMPNCSDHTGASGNGNMMMVNGDVTPNVNVWSTTVTVTPNTNYNFSAWIQNITTINPAQLQFSIDGIKLGPPITANINFCIWDRFFANWNSGNKTSATISLVNMNTVFSGNDFALDDISFSPVSIKRDSVVITVDTPHVITNSVAPVCAGIPVQLNASGAVSYSWTPSTGLSNANIANPVATPASTTTYTVTGTTVNGCSAQSPVTVTILPASNFDFSYSQDVCNPLSIQFSTAGTVPVNPYWSYGDGNIISGNANPVHVYPTYGNYTVKYHIDNASCPDTVTKIISIQLNNADIIFTPDTTICFGSSKQLRAQSSPSFCWSPATYLNDPASSTPITSTPGNITYYYTSLVTGNNIIVNGDFSQGNTGFSSQYNYANPNITEGEYFVGTSPTAWNGGLSPCTDHTGSAGNGNMMMVNGAPVAGVKVWTQNVTVTPNTNYAFSAWIEALYPPNPASLRFSINGIDIGTTITASLPTCTWKQFYTTWNSGNLTNATISIVNQNTFVQGNDFALDDISFAAVTVKRDSVIITVDTPHITAGGTAAVCAGTPAPLLATGAATYSWLPATGLSNPAVSNPVATPAGTTTYIVTGTTSHGCAAQGPPVTITVLPKPVITKSGDTAICSTSSVQLLAGGGNIYVWTPAATLSNPNIANPVATPTASVTKYYVTVINSAVNNCPNSDSVIVSLRPAPVFTVSAPAITCEGTAVQLTASGGDKFLWSPSVLVSNPVIANPLTNTNSTTSYTVTITETTCNISTTLSTVVTVNPAPLINAFKSNDIDCSNGSAILQASGAAGYIWSPATGLNNANIANPVASPAISTQYIVTGTNAYGCSSSDTVDVAVTTNGKSGYYMPNSFTPNGDGINDCFGIKFWGQILQLEFMIYNRYGEKVFYTTDPAQCWNGMYKTVKADPGNYVYYIKANTNCGPSEKKGNVILIR